MRTRHLGSERGDIEYLYDGDSIIDELHNNSTSLVAHYRYGDRLLSLTSGGSDQFYHYAGLGTTANLTNAAGEAQIAYRTDPFGQITQQEGTSVNRHVFTGQEHDEQTGLIYFGARFYDPDVAGFINQDSYLGESTTPPSLHRYLYAYSNPLYYTDPDGHCPVCFMGVVALGGTLIDYMFSDRRERVREQIKPESIGGMLASDAVAFTQSASNTISFGYFDANEQGGTQGVIEHTKENFLPINAVGNAYQEFTSPNGDPIAGALYGLKAAGQVASLGLMRAPASKPFLVVESAEIRAANKTKPNITNEKPNIAAQAETEAGMAYEHPVVANKINVNVSGVFKEGENLQAVRFGELSGGGDFAFARNANRTGIEGFFKNSQGESLPVSLKNLTTENPKNVFRVIRNNADEIIFAEGLPATNNQSLSRGTLQDTIIHVQTPNIERSALTDFINNSKPNIFTPNAFKEIILDAPGGVIVVRNGKIVKGG